MDVYYKLKKDTHVKVEEEEKIESVIDDIDIFSNNSISKCNRNDISKYFDYPLEVFLKLFPEMNYGF